MEERVAAAVGIQPVLHVAPASGSRAPPRSPPASPAAPPGCSSRSAAVRGSRCRTRRRAGRADRPPAPPAACRRVATFSRKPRRSTRNLRPSGMVVNWVSSRSRGGSSARRSAALAIGEFGRIAGRLHLRIGGRDGIRIGIEAGQRAQELLASGLIQALVGLRQLGRPIARADLAAAARQTGAHLRGDRLVLDARRHVAPDRGDPADGAVEQSGDGDVTHADTPRGGRQS